MKVVIAYDSLLIRQRLIDILSEVRGIEVIGEAGHGEAAMDYIQKLDPDVVVLDIRMPKSNGIEVLRRIRGNGAFLIVLMVTDYAYPQYRKACIEAGADHFLDKATEFERIPEILKQLVSNACF